MTLTNQPNTKDSAPRWLLGSGFIYGVTVSSPAPLAPLAAGTGAIPFS